MTVCVGGVPDTTKLLQLGFVYLMLAAVAKGETATVAIANNRENSGTERRDSAKRL